MVRSSRHFDAFRSSVPDLTGKTMAITGTTTGTGAVAADIVAGAGARTILLNRPSDRATRAAAQLRETHPDAEIVDIECDLQSFASVRAAADVLNQACADGLDVLCNNAGIMAFADEATEDGCDIQMQTNHLSHFLLTSLVMSSLDRAAAQRGEARVVNHSSIARMVPTRRLAIENLQKRGGQLGGDDRLGYKRWYRYHQTKLANAAFTAALHAYLQERGSSIKSLVAHPGLATTNIQANAAKAGGMTPSSNAIVQHLAQSASDGALGILSAMVFPKVQSGTFWGPGLGLFALRGAARVFPLERFYDNPETRKLLWEASCETTGAVWA